MNIDALARRNEIIYPTKAKMFFFRNRVFDAKAHHFCVAVCLASDIPVMMSTCIDS